MSSLETPAFRLTRWREAYAIDDVDDLLSRVRPLLEGRLPNPEVAEMIRSSRFTPVRLRLGYDMDEVDAYLDRIQTLASQGHHRR
jgi:DivIVA domain-containing protein